MEKVRTTDYVFEELSVQIDMLRRLSTFSLAGGIIQTPQVMGVHRFNPRRKSMTVKNVACKPRSPGLVVTGVQIECQSGLDLGKEMTLTLEGCYQN